MATDSIPLRALILVATLKPTPTESSSDKMAKELGAELEKLGVENEYMRAVDFNIKPGVEKDEGDGDDWPLIRQKMLDADIFIVSTPTWVGQMSSIALRVIERLDAELGETDDNGRLLTYGKVAGVAIVGNEDGAHKITADMFQSLNDLGFTIPAQAATYWNGEAMHTNDYVELSEIPQKVASTHRSVARHIAHVARLLKQYPFPPENS